jgi:hypothetical protein
LPRLKSKAFPRSEFKGCRSRWSLGVIGATMLPCGDIFALDRTRVCIKRWIDFQR